MPGVVGVFWGSPRRDGGWTKHRALCVHVRRKWNAPRSERIARAYYGFPTDVLAVGDIRHHSVLDTTDQVESANERSSISALAKRVGPLKGERASLGRRAPAAEPTVRAVETKNGHPR